ncbi:MAG: DUF2784 domain-containing protein [Nitrospinae bacterium]|nr:DUF2784 domain-containing protein [Nitrospinota bacterium]
MHEIFADLVLVLHVTYAGFVLGGFLLLSLGLCCGWAWVRVRAFRLSHLVCTTLVGVEALMGLTCPLTWLENIFLQASGTDGYDGSFVSRILHWLLYYDLPTWVFRGAYVALALGVLTLFFYAPPAGKPRDHRLLSSAAGVSERARNSHSRTRERTYVGLNGFIK